MRMAKKLPDIDPGPMLHGSVVKVDLEPVPDGDGRAGKSQDVLHSAPVIWIWTSRPSMGPGNQDVQRGGSGSRERKPSRKRRNTPPSRVRAGPGSGETVRWRAMGWS